MKKPIYWQIRQNLKLGRIKCENKMCDKVWQSNDEIILHRKEKFIVHTFNLVWDNLNLEINKKYKRYLNIVDMFDIFWKRDMRIKTGTRLEFLKFGTHIFNIFLAMTVSNTNAVYSFAVLKQTHYLRKNLKLTVVIMHLIKCNGLN